MELMVPIVEYFRGIRRSFLAWLSAVGSRHYRFFGGPYALPRLVFRFERLKTLPISFDPILNSIFCMKEIQIGRFSLQWVISCLNRGCYPRLFELPAAGHGRKGITFR